MSTVTTSLSPRLQALRERAIRAPQEISLVRARAFSEAFRSHQDEVAR